MRRPGLEKRAPVVHVKLSRCDTRCVVQARSRSPSVVQHDILSPMTREKEEGMPQQLAAKIWRCLEQGKHYRNGQASQHSDEYTEERLFFQDGQVVFEHSVHGRSDVSVHRQCLTKPAFAQWLAERQPWRRKSLERWFLGT